MWSVVELCVCLLLIASCHGVYYGTGTSFFTHMQEQSKFGVRAVYRLDGTFAEILPANETKACISFLMDFQRPPGPDIYNLLSRWPAIRGDLIWSAAGRYYYYETARRNLVSENWIPYRINIYRADNFPGCKSNAVPVYQDSGNSFHVPANITYCELDNSLYKPFPGYPTTQCSRVLDELATEGTVKKAENGPSVTTSVAPVTESEKAVNTQKKRGRGPEPPSTTPKCRGNRCRAHHKRVLLAIGSIPVILVLLVLFSGIFRWAKAKKSGRTNTGNTARTRVRPADTRLTTEFDLSLIILPDRGAASDTPQEVQLAPPQYKDIQADEPPPSYDELSQLSVPCS